MRLTPPLIPELLASTWKEVLGLPSVGANDNFFELGGDSWTAVAIFSELSKIFGREISPVIIFHAPTISALSAVLSNPKQTSLPSLTPLKPGGTGRPLYFVHGCGSTVLELFNVVKYIRSPRPIFGMQARGTDGTAESFDRFEDLAQYHLDAIRRVQPKGPYLLAGFSAGGLIAFEMARRLSGAGDNVALLTVIDGFPALRLLKKSQLLNLKLRRHTHRATARIKRLLSTPLRSSQNRFKHPPLIPMPNTSSMARFKERDYEALGRYEPRFYDGAVRFLRAADAWIFSVDPRSIWAPLAAEFSLESVPGDHTGIVTTHAEDLAVALCRHIDEADPPRACEPAPQSSVLSGA